MGLLKSVVKKVALTAAVLVGRRLINKLAGKLADKVVKPPPAAK